MDLGTCILCVPVGSRYGPLALNNGSLLSPFMCSSFTTLALNPHMGCSGVPFMNRTTLWSLTICESKSRHFAFCLLCFT